MEGVREGIVVAAGTLEFGTEAECRQLAVHAWQFHLFLFHHGVYLTVLADLLAVSVAPQEVHHFRWREPRGGHLAFRWLKYRNFHDVGLPTEGGFAAVPGLPTDFHRFARIL